MIQDKTKYEEYSKDQEIHDLKDIINSLESKIESLENQLSISRVVKSFYCRYEKYHKIYKCKTECENCKAMKRKYLQ